MATAYPLSWPAGWKRAASRRRADFGRVKEDSRGWKSREPLTLEQARKRLADELDRLGASNEILSTNLQLRADGWPKGGQRAPDDVGVAVYFNYAKRPTVLACDKWDRVEDNIAAVAKHIEAMRGMDRWGVGSVEQAFTGYAALPAPDAWWEILGFGMSTQPNGDPWAAEAIREAWARESRKFHPDKPGGSHDKQARINVARDEGLAAVGGQ